MKLTIAVLIAASIAPSASFAQGTAEQRASCTPDVFRLCASEIPNVDGIIACLKREKPKLSAGCRLVMENADKKVATASTRSIRPMSEWCHFTGANKPVEEVWRGWCKDAVWTD